MLVEKNILTDEHIRGRAIKKHYDRRPKRDTSIPNYGGMKSKYGNSGKSKYVNKYSYPHGCAYCQQRLFNSRYKQAYIKGQLYDQLNEINRTDVTLDF